MNWKNSVRASYQQSEAGEVHPYYFVYRYERNEWRAGRNWFGRDVDFRITFPSAKVARWYVEQYDKEKAQNIIVAI